MPRRGERARDFRHDALPLPPVRIGVRQVAAPDSAGVSRVIVFDPAAFGCRTVAAELGDEWVDYVALTGVRAGTARSYRRAMNSFCRFIDDNLADVSAPASMARADPDLGSVLLAWEDTLASGWAQRSTHPATAATNIRTLINRRSQHPEREVAPGLRGVAAGQHALHGGSTRELDEYSRADKAALVHAAWADIGHLEQRISAGWALAASGGHPAQRGWLNVPNLLWGLAHDVVTPREIAKNLPNPWPPELVALLPPAIQSVSAHANGMRRYFLLRALLRQLYPAQQDLHAFRVLLVAATGHAPEEITGLSEHDVDFTPGGVRLTLTKNRARRIRHRAFTRVSAAGLEQDQLTHADRPRLEVSVIVRRLMTATAPLRERFPEQPAPLFLQASIWMRDWQVSIRRFNHSTGPNASFAAWIDRMGLHVDGPADVRRLRKSTKVEKAIAFGGRITDIADDHHEQTFRGHYAQGTTLRIVSGTVITTAQRSWFDKVVQGPIVLDTDAETTLAATPSADALSALGMDAERIEKLRSGAMDMGVSGCRDPFDSPFSRPGELCAVAPLRCLECRNAWILPSHLPQLLLFSDHLQAMRRRLSPAHFHTLWGQSAANLAAVLDARSKQEIDIARRHITDGVASLQLPLAARAEFDA
jgi:hypothetical protein